MGSGGASLKYVNRIRRGGRVYCYWRRRGYSEVPLPGDPEHDRRSAEIVLRLNSEIDRSKLRVEQPHEGTLSHLIALYLASPDLEMLSEATQRHYKHWCNKLKLTWGNCRLSKLDRQGVYAIRDKLAERPHQANACLRMLRILCGFAVDRDMIKVNPATRPKSLSVTRRRSQWSAEAEGKLLAACEDKTLRMAFLLGLHTAQRLGDVLAMTWGQYDGTYIRLKQQKTGTLVSVYCHRTLKAELDVFTRRGTLMLLSKTGRPYHQRVFNRDWKRACTAAGVADVQFRDLRRTAMVRLAEAGATSIEIAAISGHTIDVTQRILETYIPRNEAMGKGAIVKLESFEQRPKTR